MAGFAACFHGALTLVAMKRRIQPPADLSISASTTSQRDPAQGLLMIALDLEVSMPVLASRRRESSLRTPRRLVRTWRWRGTDSARRPYRRSGVSRDVVTLSRFRKRK
ncbi:hypothetical protein [Burkholderia sp. IMCC1007]|uniref:hypothetical protein n=1 Tax=Burkholderia sp. IMCC1007 TaxID=3004104 RepID=UPI002F968F2D